MGSTERALYWERERGIKRESEREVYQRSENLEAARCCQVCPLPPLHSLITGHVNAGVTCYKGQTTGHWLLHIRIWLWYTQHTTPRNAYTTFVKTGLQFPGAIVHLELKYHNTEESIRNLSAVDNLTVSLRWVFPIHFKQEPKKVLCQYIIDPSNSMEISNLIRDHIIRCVMSGPVYTKTQNLVSVLLLLVSPDPPVL